LFVAGKFAIGLYIGTSEVGSVYGAAGSLVIILVWIYYSALILFYGAELTQAWSKRVSGRTTPAKEHERRG
jgi:membrane protein